MTGSKQQRYLRAADVAALVGVDLRTVRRWIARGALPSAKIGGTRLIREVDLLRILGSDKSDLVNSDIKEWSTS